MINQTIVNKQPDTKTHLRSIFEQCLAVLCEDKGSATGEKTGRRRCDSLPLRLDGVNLQKRALSEAANALATLWKISGRRCPKPQDRALHFSRSTP
jgi:hypothetical protein